MTRRLALALRHVGFEDLGSFEIPLKEAGYAIEYIDIAERDPATLDPLDADLFFILGGPISVYDHADYPFIAAEIELLRVRLGADLPTLDGVTRSRVPVLVNAEAFGAPIAASKITPREIVVRISVFLYL